MIDTTDKLHLHDEAVTKLLWKGNELYLGLEHYDDAQKAYAPYSILFCGIRAMTVDHVRTTDVTPPSDSGEVLRYKEADGKAFLLIEWFDFKKRVPHTKLYEFDFDHRETHHL